MAEIGKNLKRVKELLDLGELVAIPTETVYGLAGGALMEEAILKVFKVKNRPSFDPLIAHTDHLDKVKGFVKDIPDKAQMLADAYWPGALTLLLPKKEHVPDVLTSGLPDVAVRIPNHPITLELLSLLSYPLAAPSANPFGYVSPTSPQHVADKLGDRIPYILDGGRCEIGVESTIVGFENEDPIIYRLGGLTVEDIENVCGPVQVKINQSSNPKAPGMIKSHYAPNKPIIIVELEKSLTSNDFDRDSTGVISFCKNYQLPYQFVLSDQGNIEQAAYHLFTALRYFDDLPVNKILVELMPNIGLGRAINDRLGRASSKYLSEKMN